MTDPETGPHARTEILREERESSRWATWLGIGLALAFVAIAAVGSVIVIQGMDDAGSKTLTSSLPTASPSAAEPSETLEAAEATSPSAAPVRRARTPEEVLKRTRFVARYRGSIPDISRKHPDIGKNGLANHGATLCAMIEDRSSSIFDMVRVFMIDFHAHPGPVTEQKALLAIDMAVQEICPDLKSRLSEKLDI